MYVNLLCTGVPKGNVHSRILVHIKILLSKILTRGSNVVHIFFIKTQWKNTLKDTIIVFHSKYDTL